MQYYKIQWSKCLSQSLWVACHNHLKTIHGKQTWEIEISQHNFIDSAITSSQKLNASIFQKKWPRNDSNVEDDPYEALVLIYSMVMDQLMEANTINN